MGQGSIRMDENKIRAIKNWKELTKPMELRSFLRLVNYCRLFIWEYSKIVVPLIGLLKKNVPWGKGHRCQEAFDNLKKVVMVEPVLALPDFNKPFEVYTNASDFAFSRVLMQEGYSVAF